MPIVQIDGELIVAVPFVARHRTVSQRLLPKGGLSKPVPVEVSVRLLEEAAEEGGIDITTKAWVGFLSAELVQTAVICAITAEFGEELHLRVQLSALVLPSCHCGRALQLRFSSESQRWPRQRFFGRPVRGPRWFLLFASKETRRTKQ